MILFRSRKRSALHALANTPINGKVCYLEIPAVNVDDAVHFYTTLFSWKVRTRGDGSRAFDDAAGAVSGSWVTGRRSAADSGVLVYVMVDSIDATLGRVSAAGGTTVTPKTAISPTAAFAVCCDPAGNRVGVYEEEHGGPPPGPRMGALVEANDD